MSDSRVLGFVWTFLTLVVAYILAAATMWTFTTFGVTNPRVVGTTPLSMVVGVIAALAIGGGLWAAAKPRTFAMEVVEETRKVVWPAFPEVRDSTLVVVVTSVIFSLVLGVFDLVWAKITNMILLGSA